jgi:hypothetical protein
VGTGLKLFGIGFLAQSFVFIAAIGSTQMAYNKLLNFVPATKSVASTGLPTLRQPISKALDTRMQDEA